MQVVGTLYTHHQKITIVDSQGPGNKRKLTSFIGGLDLCDGRFDTPSHSLFSTINTLHKNDFHNPTFTVSSLSLSATGLRSNGCHFSLSFSVAILPLHSVVWCILRFTLTYTSFSRSCYRDKLMLEDHGNPGMTGIARSTVLQRMIFSPILSKGGGRPLAGTTMNSSRLSASPGFWVPKSPFPLKVTPSCTSPKTMTLILGIAR